MAKSGNSGADHVITAVSPAGGITADSMIMIDATNETVGLVMAPTTTATGVNYACKVGGLVTGVSKSTAAAWVQGDHLASNTACVFAVATAGDRAQGYAAAAATAAATTGDIILTGTHLN